MGADRSDYYQCNAVPNVFKEILEPVRHVAFVVPGWAAATRRTVPPVRARVSSIGLPLPTTVSLDYKWTAVPSFDRVLFQDVSLALAIRELVILHNGTSVCGFKSR